MDKFFEKHSVTLGESHAIDAIVEKAKKVKRYYNKGYDYDECLKELSTMIDDFFAYRTT